MLAVGCTPPDPEWAHEWRLAGRLERAAHRAGDGDLRPLPSFRPRSVDPHLKAILVMRPHKIYCAHAELWAADGRHGEGGRPGTGHAGAFASPREGAKNALLFAGLNHYMVSWSGSICSSNGIVNHAAER